MSNSSNIEIFFKGPEQQRGHDFLFCFPSEHTLYPVTVKTASNRYVIKKRYREFAELDQEIRRMFDDSDVFNNLPELPPKSYLGSSSPILIHERKSKLESYLRKLTEIQEVAKSGPLLTFLEIVEGGNDGNKGPMDFWPAQCRACGQPLAAGREAQEGVCNLCFKAEFLMPRTTPRQTATRV